MKITKADPLQLIMLITEFNLPEGIYNNKDLKDIMTSNINVYPRCLRVRFNKNNKLVETLRKHDLCSNRISYSDKEIWFQINA